MAIFPPNPSTDPNMEIFIRALGLDPTHVSEIEVYADPAMVEMKVSLRIPLDHFDKMLRNQAIETAMDEGVVPPKPSDGTGRQRYNHR